MGRHRREALPTRRGSRRRVRRLRAITITALAIAGMLLATPLAGAGTLDQSHTTNPGGWYYVVSASQTMAQTFTAGITGSLDQIDVEVGKINGTPGTLYVKVMDTSGGVPAGPALATATVAEPAGYGLSWMSLVLDPAVPVTAGHQYALVLAAPTALDRCPFFDFSCRPSQWAWGTDVDNYSGGTVAVTGSNFPSWTTFTYNDMTFKTFVGSAPVDSSPPAVDCGVLPTGWQADDVTLICTASDVGPSGLADPADATFSLSTSVGSGSESAGASTETRTVYDVAGNHVTTGPFSFMVDRKAPTVARNAAGDSCTLPGNAGWCRGTQFAGFSAVDGGSGLAPDGAGSRDFSRQNAGEGPAVMIASGAVADMVGNSAPSLDAGPYKIDSEAPSVSCPAPVPVFELGQADALVAASVSDAISGPASAAVAGAVETDSVGGKTISLTGYDNAGNGREVACSYRVVYDWSGFFQPVDNRDASGSYVVNKAKAGSTIPVKFSLAGDQGLAIFALNSPSSGAIACSSAATTDTIEQYTSATVSGLRYDPLANQYVYSWKTESGWANSCRQLVVKLIDGSEHRANFQFVK